jgi:hypothetical protein
MNELRFPEISIPPGEEVATFVVADRSLRLDSLNTRIDDHGDCDLIISDFAVNGISRLPPQPVDILTVILHRNYLGGGVSFGMVHAGSSILFKLKNPTDRQMSFRCRINLHRAEIRR